MSDHQRFEASTNDLTAALHRATITMRRHVTKLPNDNQRNFPLQELKAIQCYDVPAILRRANHAKRQRLQQLLRRLNNPAEASSASSSSSSSTATATHVPVSPSCPPEHCEYYERHGIYRRVTPSDEAARPSRGTLHVFTVVEVAKVRLRTIHHPRRQNDYVYANDGYTAQMPELQHPSKFLPAVATAGAACHDISASFYGVTLDETARASYRFRDSSGHLWEMCRMMMGHVLSAEIQHIITCIAAGHRDYVDPDIATQCPHIAVWIDGIRYAGSSNLVAAANRNLERTCDELKIAMRHGQFSLQYDFVGMHFDHTDRTVRIASKTADKLPQRIAATMRADELESLVGRLIFASAVRQDPLINRYWCLKSTRRIFNQLNRGIIKSDTIIELTNIMRRGLEHWLQSAPLPHTYEFRNGKTATLFTDATLAGWGAILVINTGEFFVAGSHFSADALSGTHSINHFEARAVDFALAAFAAQLDNIDNINLFVDNTSVQHDLQRGHVSADDMVAPIAAALQKITRRNKSLFVAYISTKLNPADAISRGKRVDVPALQQAMRATIK